MKTDVGRPRPQVADPADMPGSRALPPPAMAVFHRLHATVRLAVEHLLPQGRGSIFVARLLVDASIKQVDIPGLGLVETLVVSLPSMESFARQHKQGRDTVYRYLDVLEALGILFRFRRAGATVLQFPLIPWAPSVDAYLALDALQAQGTARDKRDKLRQLARSVQDRFKQLYGEPATWPCLYDHLQATLSELSIQLDTCRMGTTRRALQQLRISSLQSRLAGPEGACLQQGVVCAEAATHDRCSVARQGVVAPGEPLANGHRPAQEGVVPAENVRQQGHNRVQEGVFSADVSLGDGGVPARQGVVAPGEPLANGHRPAQEGVVRSWEQPLTLDVNRSSPSLERRKEKNVNVAHIPVSPQAIELAEAVEGHSGNAVHYTTWLNTYDARLMMAIFVYTVQQAERAKNSAHPVETPGAYFQTMVKIWSAFGSYEAACNAYEQASVDRERTQGTPAQKLPGIPTHVQALVRQYATGWTYKAIAQELVAASQERSTRKAGTSAQRSPNVPELAAGARLREPEQWMDQEEAQALAEQIKGAVADLPRLRLEVRGIRPYHVRGEPADVWLVGAAYSSEGFSNVPMLFASREQFFQDYLAKIKPYRH